MASRFGDRDILLLEAALDLAPRELLPRLTDASYPATRHWDETALTAGVRPHALQRIGRPTEIVGAALYLISDASSYTTGATLRADGGMP